jgi:hypothetical protein
MMQEAFSTRYMQRCNKKEQLAVESGVGSLKSETVKYGRESQGNRTQE